MKEKVIYLLPLPIPFMHLNLLNYQKANDKFSSANFQQKNVKMNCVLAKDAKDAYERIGHLLAAIALPLSCILTV